MVAVVGFALLGLMVTRVRKQVFLLVITVITNVMHCMTTTAITVQKAVAGRPKSPPLAVKKNLIPKFILPNYRLIPKSFFVESCPNTEIFCREIWSDTEIFGLFAHCG